MLSKAGQYYLLWLDVKDQALNVPQLIINMIWSKESIKSSIFRRVDN
jgi:hypothetical protein